MGTSNSYGGPGGGTPLIPSWLGGGEGSINKPPQKEADSDNSSGPKEDGKSDKPKKDSDKPSSAGTSGDRYRSARTNLTKFAGAGGGGTANLRKALSGYVKTSSGGARNAARRMGTSRSVAAGLLSFLGDVQQRGTADALQSRNLGQLAGKPIAEIFLGLSDYICPETGSVDEGISRNAFIETIADLADEGITDLDSLNTDQIQTVLELYAAHAIEARLCNDIGKKLFTAPESLGKVEKVQNQLRDFIRRSVADAINQEKVSLTSITPANVNTLVQGVYENAFEILQILEQEESQE